MASGASSAHSKFSWILIDFQLLEATKKKCR